MVKAIINNINLLDKFKKFFRNIYKNHVYTTKILCIVYILIKTDNSYRYFLVIAYSILH